MRESDPDHLDLQPMNKGRFRGIVIGLVLLAIAIGAAVVVNTQFRAGTRATFLRQASTAWNGFRRCLVGTYEPRGESIAARVRRIEIGIPLTQRHPDLVQHGTAWPFRCARFVSLMTHQLFESRSEDPNHRMLMSLASRAATALDEGDLHTGRADRRAYIEEIFEVARRANLGPGDPARGAVPPEPANPLTPRAMTPLFSGADAAQFVAQDPLLGRTLRVLLGGAVHRLCTADTASDAGHGAVSVRCHLMSFPAAGIGIDVAAADDRAGDFLRVANASGGGFSVHRLEATAPIAPGPSGAWVRADGATASVFAVGHPSVTPGAITTNARAPDDGWQLSRTREGAGVETVALRIPEPTAELVLVPIVLDGYVMAARASPAAPRADAGDAATADASDAAIDAGDAGAARDAGDAGDVLDAGDTGDAGDSGDAATPAPIGPSGPATIFVRAVDAAPAAPFDRIGVAQEVSRGATLSSCRTASSVAFALRSGDHVNVFFRIADRWSAISHVVAPPATVTCRGTEIAFTWTEIQPRRLIHQTRCTPTGCTTAQGPFPEFESPPMVTDLDGQVLIVHSPRGAGLRMRLASLSRIASTDDVYITDDDTHGGLGVQSVSPLFVRDRVALVFVTSRDAPHPVFAIHIGPDGVFTPIRTAPARSD